MMMMNRSVLVDVVVGVRAGVYCHVAVVGVAGVHRHLELLHCQCC